MKNASKDNLLPRGGSALLNDVDGNLTLWRKDDIAELSWQGKYRGKPPGPIKFEQSFVGLTGMHDDRGQPLTCAVVRPMAPEREKRLAEEKVSNENRTLAVIRDNPGILKAALIAKLDEQGVASSTAYRVVKGLNKKWVNATDGRFVLTPLGKKVLGDDS